MPLSLVRTFLRWVSLNRSIRLTSDGVCFVLLSVGIGVASINTGNNLLYLLFAMMLSLIVISGVLSERCFKQVHVSRRLPPALFANQSASAAFVMANRSSRLPVFSLRVMDLIEGTSVDRDIHLLHLLPGAMTIQSYPVLVTKRGPYVFEGIKLFTRFPFGLFMKAATFPLRSEVMVYPEIQDLPPVLLDRLSMVGHDQSMPRGGQGTTLHNLRLYQPGDDSRTIHWKTTARKSLLIVRETEAEDQRQVTIVLHTDIADRPDGPALQASFEKAVSLAASLAVLFTERVYEVRLVVGEQELAYEIGQAHLFRMLSLLAVCRPIIESSARPRESFRLMGSRGNELTVHVLAYPDSRLIDAANGASRVLLASEFVTL
jgi:uncharacterized protein (DUF58 family)